MPPTRPVLYWAAEHAKQLVFDDAPRSSDEVPAGQGRHTFEVAPTTLDQVFAGHLMQPEEDPVLYEPAGHRKGGFPSGQVHPGGQGVVSTDVPSGQKKPAEQLRHVATDDAPVSCENRPPGHGVGLIAGDGQ